MGRRGKPVLNEGRTRTEGTGRLRALALAFCLLPLSLTGCAGVWDEVTSRDFNPRSLFVSPDPMEVLRHDPDGDHRAKALRALREPKQAGGTDQVQDEALAILTKAAVNDKQPWCRLAAIETLGRFQDPRAAQVLVSAYDQAANTRDPRNLVQQAAYFPPAGTFQPETVATIRCQALLALGQTRSSAALDRLVGVVRQPPVEGAEQEQQLTMDERIAAARALANFNQPPAVEALVHVMQTEKDVALRNRARESLETITGRKIPPDFKDWDSLRTPAGNPEAPAADGARKGKFLGLF
jgi:HEAT repeat protein